MQCLHCVNCVKCNTNKLKLKLEYLKFNIFNLILLTSLFSWLNNTVVMFFVNLIFKKDSKFDFGILLVFHTNFIFVHILLFNFLS